MGGTGSYPPEPADHLERVVHRSLCIRGHQQNVVFRVLQVVTQRQRCTFAKAVALSIQVVLSACPSQQRRQRPIECRMPRQDDCAVGASPTQKLMHLAERRHGARLHDSLVGDGSWRS